MSDDSWLSPPTFGPVTWSPDNAITGPEGGCPLGILWVDDANDRHYVPVPGHLWSWTVREALLHWKSLYLLTGSALRSLPRWVFFEADNRQKLFRPADIDTDRLRNEFRSLLPKGGAP